MKNTIALLGLMIMMTVAFSQEDITEYYSDTWEKTEQENAVFMRIGEQTTSGSFVGIVTDFYLSGEQFAKGEIKEGEKEGVWQGNYKNGSKYFTETYNKGVLIRGVSYDADSNSYRYRKLVIPPKPEGGKDNFAKYTQEYWDNVLVVLAKKYPDYISKLIDKKAQKTVLIKFTVKVDGSVEVIEVTNGSDFGFDNEIARHMFDKYKKWIPGKVRGQIAPVTTEYQMKVTF
jgi:hypothetical protein